MARKINPVEPEQDVADENREGDAEGRQVALLADELGHDPLK